MATKDGQLLATKTRQPQLPLHWITRPRLSGKLREALRCKLLLISAPAGYGKTTLVIEALRDSHKPIGWISLDASENNPINFWAYFITALQNVVPTGGQPIINALQSPQPPPADWLLTNLINMITGIPDDFALVLDDYHVISSPNIHEAMQFLIEHLPPQAHLIIITRSDPPWPLARWRVKGDIAEFRAGDLSFTAEETAAFIRDITGKTLVESDLATLESRTEGWIAGIKMAVLSLQGKKDISGYIKAFSGTNRYILDYLAEEVLDQQPPDIKQFLIETSILENLSGPLCDTITERSDSQNKLHQLELANLFISPLDDERHWYRYHQLFATILRHQLAKEVPEKEQLLHLRASEWYEKEGITTEAVNHALLGNDTERAAMLVENTAPAMLGQNQAVALLEYASRIPEPIIHASPWLCVCFAWAALTANRSEILMKMLSRAVEALSESPETFSPSSRANLLRLKGHVLSLQSIIAQAQDDIPRAIRLAEEADRELPGNQIDDLLARAVNSLNLSAYYQKTGDITKAIPLIEDLVATGRRSDYHYAILSGRGSLADIQMQLSRLEQASRICHETIKEGTLWGGDFPLPATALAYVVLGKLNYEQNDLKNATVNLNRGIEIGEASFNLEPVLTGYLNLANLSQAENNPGKAMECIRRAENVGPWVVIPPEVQQLPAWKTRLVLRQGDFATASNWARQQEIALPLSQLPGYRQEFAYLTLIRVNLATGNCQGIPGYLDNFINNAMRQQRNSSVIEALILKALAQDCLSEPDKAEETFRQALALAEPAGYIRIFIDEGTPLVRLLQKVADGSPGDYASRLLEIIAPPTNNQIFQPASPVIPGLIEPLSERELEILKLIAAGRSNKEIGDTLFLAIGTVKKHTNNIFGKLSVASRTQAIARARELGIL